MAARQMVTEVAGGKEECAGYVLHSMLSLADQRDSGNRGSSIALSSSHQGVAFRTELV